jgi:hypothetical protein
MRTNTTIDSHREAIDETSAWLVGGGIVTLALFPLALPGIALAVIAALPLLLVALVGGLVAALFVLPVRLARLVVRALRTRSADRPAVDRIAAAPVWRLRPRGETR